MLHASPKRLPMSYIHAYFGKKCLVRNQIKKKMHNILCIKFFWEIILRGKKIYITFSGKCPPYVTSGLPINGWFLLQVIYLYVH